MRQRRTRILNRRIQLEVPFRTPNGAGGFTKGWAPPAWIWAEMVPLRGDETTAYALQTNKQIWRATIRYRGDVDVQARITFDGDKLNIRSLVDPDGKRRWLELTCESGVKT